MSTFLRYSLNYLIFAHFVGIIISAREIAKDLEKQRRARRSPARLCASARSSSDDYSAGRESERFEGRKERIRVRVFSRSINSRAFIYVERNTFESGYSVEREVARLARRAARAEIPLERR